MSGKDRHERQVSRRGFLKGTALGAAAVAAGGLLEGCQQAAPSNLPAKWDKETDVVVLGGGTGVIAAVRAADAGAKVILVEKGKAVGGTTATSGGGIWAPNNYVMQKNGIADSREEAIKYMQKATFGQSNDELIAAYVDNVNAMVEYTRTLGIEWEPLMGFGFLFQDYYGDAFEGGKPNGRTISPVSTVEGVQMGGFLMYALNDAAKKRGVETLLETAGKRLVVNPGGVVVGVMAEAQGKEIFIKAKRGVILATGGFDHNETMTTHFLRGPIYYPSAVAANTGEGQLMGMAIGADLRNMNEVWGWPVYYNPDAKAGIPDAGTERGRPGAIIVNRHGERFCDESAAYDPVARGFYFFDTGTFEYRNIPGYIIVDSEYQKRYSLAYNQPGQEWPAWIARADTLEELAAALEIDPAGLKATVETFNANAAEGRDPLFHRGEAHFDVQTCGDPQRTELKNICLAPVATPPFYGLAIWPGALGTCGGLRINGKGQVVNVFDQVIPRLYAVGNASGSVMGAGYPGGGATVGAGLTIGYLAGVDAAALKPWE